MAVGADAARADGHAAKLGTNTSGAGGKVASYFSSQIANLLSKEIGQRVTAHQFRHLIGYLFLLEHQGNYEVVRRLLGHQLIETTVKFYAEIEMHVAAKTVDTVIKRRRVELASLAQQPLRRGRRK